MTAPVTADDDATAAVGGVHHVAILVRDLPRAEAFYRDVLGLAVVRRDGARSVWLDLGKGAFLALETTAEPETRAATGAGERPGFHLLALAIGRDERRAWERRLAAAALEIYHRTPYTLYVRDPEGNRIGLSHWPNEAIG